MRLLFSLTVVVIFCSDRCFSQVTASFTTSASTVCTNTPVTITNTSTGATNYYWSFCAADFNTTPEAVNLGNLGGLLSTPDFGDYAKDDNGNYYGLVGSYADGNLIRLNFGTSLLNQPTAEDLGTFGGIIPNQSEGIQIVRANGNWSVILVGGAGTVANSDPRIVKIDFGNSLANTPTATNWGNVGGVNLPHDLFISQEGGGYVGFTINVNDNTFTRFNWGADFTSPPTGVNLGNIGGLNYPAGFTFVNYGGSWYAFIANRDDNSLTRLSFGSSLMNPPVAVKVSNPGGLLSEPRDVSLFQTCSGLFGFVSNEATNHLVKLDFGSDPTSMPTATDLGNLGDLNFPHSISNFFRVENDIYAFIPNVLGNSITRIRFAGCQDLSSTSAANPPPVSYSNAGVYNINLIVDIGLPTQRSYCQQVTVNGSPRGMLAGDTVCYGNVPELLYAGTTGAPPFSISYTDGVNNYSQAGLGSNSAVSLPYALTAVGSTSFTLQRVSDANGCSFDTTQQTEIKIAPLPNGGITGGAVCAGDTAILTFAPSNGTPPYSVEYSNGVVTKDQAGVEAGSVFGGAFTGSPTTFTITTITDSLGCIRTSGFDPATAVVVPLPAPVLKFAGPGRVCVNSGPIQLGASETTGIAGSGSYNGPGVDQSGSFQPMEAGVGVHTITYTYVADDGCKAADSSQIVVNPLPKQAPPEEIEGCDGIPVRLNATGGVSYVWSPAEGLSNAAIADPEATFDASVTYTVLVTDSNNCSVTDTVLIKDVGSIKYAFALPNAFSPNGDGHNDCFGIRQWGAVTLQELDVFNRHGARVFSTQNPSDCWDGRFNGQMQPAGTYVYVIRALTACGVVTRTGTLILIR